MGRRGPRGRVRRTRGLRLRRGGSAGGERLGHDPRRCDAAQRPRVGCVPARRLLEPRDQHRSEPDLPAHGRLRRLDHRLVRAPAARARSSDARGDDDEPVQPPEGQWAVGTPSADGRVGLRSPRLLHLRRPPGGADRLRHEQVLDRARPGYGPAPVAQGAGAQRAAEGDRVALERPGVDEDEWVVDRWAAHRRPADLRGLRALLRQVRSRLRARRRPGVRPDRSERAAEPQSERLPRHGPPRRAGSEADRGARPGSPGGRVGHEDPRLRPQLGDAPRRHRVDPAGGAARDRVPERPALERGGTLRRRHRVPLLLR